MVTLKFQSHREVGNAKISEKSSNFQSEATAQVIQKTGTGKMSTVVQSSFTSTKVVSTKSSTSSSSVKSIEEDTTKSISF